MDRGRVRSGLIAERSTFISEVSELAQELRVEIAELHNQFGALARQAGVSHARLGTRVGPTMTALELKLLRLEQIARSASPHPTDLAKPAPVIKKQRALEIY